MPIDTSGILATFFDTNTYTQRVGDATGEPGIDVSMPAGSAVLAVLPGVFVSSLSSANELVEKIALGGKTFYLDYMHIDPGTFKPGQQISAGERVGVITKKDEPGGSFPTGAGFAKTYQSTGPHLEFGVYQPGQKVGYDFNPGLDPIGWLNDLLGGRLGAPGVAHITGNEGALNANITSGVQTINTTAHPNDTVSSAGLSNIGGAFGFLMQMLGVGADATGLTAVTGFFGRMVLTLFFIIVGTIFFFKGLNRIKA